MDSLISKVRPVIPQPALKSERDRVIKKRSQEEKREGDRRRAKKGKKRRLDITI
ncbi:hypothetical protein G4V39_10400 [Thermosulfuriphilus ammonigenes]|uniref:Uncharacterized protein n=1 Tax=Thermosulfuriphilus ammonigenes TaxID=1936021 RepID=A0A6G7PYG6_9BACT|nr:hypothetical protein [Thermosulfuriphilus ammonigenes]MBA2849792.1 hypothetical protein [Thermosulfuriphilus ammonigenes]QIJ72660.1 hypothetical protein G4V39_10400 [Thermosulfuriphilus ammonigenes]